MLLQGIEDERHGITNPQSKAIKKAAAPDSKETIEDYAKRWLEGKDLRLKPGPSSAYHNIVRDKILPRFRGIKVSELNRGLVDAWVAWAEKVKKHGGKPFSNDTLLGWWKVLCLLLRDLAVDFDLPDPTRRVRPPESHVPRSREQRVLSTDELERFLGAVRTFFPNRYAEVLTVSMTGCRPGEVYGLKWDCVDLQNNSITIRRAVSGKELVESTKTGSAREIPLHEILVEVLKEHQAQQAGKANPNNLVFPTEKGTMRIPQAARRIYVEASQNAKLGILVGPQVLRRTLNTAFVLGREDRTVLRAIIGHTNEAMTARYAGIAMEDKKAALNRVFGAFSAPTDPLPEN
jgi:integrase